MLASYRLKYGLSIFLLLQLFLLLEIIEVFQIEPNSGLATVKYFILGGFSIFLLLPSKFSRWIFLMLSGVIIYYAFGFFSGCFFILVALSLVGICHLPISFFIRVAIILSIATVLFLLRKGIFYAPRAQIVIPYLASLFMFRLIIYLFEIRHQTDKGTFPDRLSYFFMFPNLCLILFPIVDYSSFIEKSKPKDLLIVQKGIRSILRGVFHYLLYRFVYHYLFFSPLEVNNVSDLLYFMVYSYLMILRLSAIFHIAVGFLQLFGNDLPPVFNNYFFANSPSDVWRRANIYWRDFVMKVFYYPVYMRLKKWGKITSIALSTMLVFVLTWAFHSYQWFWIQGEFFISYSDGLYWLILGIAITLNTVIREVRRKKKKIKPKKWDIKRSFKRSMAISGTFIFMSFLWTFWNSPSIKDWLFLMSMSGVGELKNYLLVLTFPLIVFLIICVNDWLLTKNFIKKLMEGNLKTSLIISGLGIFSLFSVSLTTEGTTMSDEAKNFARKLTSEQLNDWDREVIERGYYDGLLGNNSPKLWELNVSVSRKGKYDPITHRTHNILFKKLKENLKVKFKGAWLSTNSFGMRDKNYSVSKPVGVTRISLMGGSYEMGSGVGDDYTFESLVEASLNNKGKNVEILNFGVGGYDLPQVLKTVETRGLKFNPDYVMIFAHTNESKRVSDAVARLIVHGRDLEYTEYESVKKMSGAKQFMSDHEIRKRLRKYGTRMVRWSYKEIAEICKKKNVKPIWVYLPTTLDPMPEKDLKNLKFYLKNLGYIVIDLAYIWDGRNMDNLVISKADSHPNVKGHKIIADALEKELLKSKVLNRYEGKN